MSPDFESKEDPVRRVFTDIKKDEKDPRHYRGLILNNQLKVMLVSDPNAKQSAACMNVNVGSFTDPEEVQGMAHLLEHMLFAGNENCEDIYDFENYCRKYCGNYNANTYDWNTIYYFYIHPKWLEEALDRFVQYFICPLLNGSLMEKEIKNINDEYENRHININALRLRLIDKETCDQNHPFHKFTWGNMKSLNDDPKSQSIDVRQMMLDFYDENYSSNQMTLCVLGRESLDQLYEMICYRLPFIEIKNKNLNSKFTDYSNYLYSPFEVEHLKKEIKIASNYDRDELIIDFKLSQHYGYTHDPFCSTFYDYLDKLINCSNINGFQFLLKQKGLINDGYVKESKIFIHLTEQGFERIDEIISHVFQYLKLLQLGAQKWIFHEESNQKCVDYISKLKEKRSFVTEDPIKCVKRIAHNMMDTDLDESAFISYSPDSDFTVLFEPYKLNKLLNCLKLDNLRIIIKSKRFKGKTDRITKYCSTDYTFKDISKKRIQKWKQIQPNQQIKLPKPRELITIDMLELVEIDLESSKSDKPILIRQDEFANVWFYQDNQFDSFKSIYGISIKNSILCRHSIAYACMSIYTLIILDKIKLKNQYPCLDFDVDLKFLDYGLFIQLTGYNEKLKLIIQQIVDLLVKPLNKFKREHFDWAKRQFFDSLFNDERKQTLNGLIRTKLRYFFLDEPIGFENEIQYHIDELTFEKVNEIKEIFFSSYIKFQIFGYGNLTKYNVKQVETMVIDRLIMTYKSNPILDPCIPRKRIPILENNSFYILQESTSIHSINLISNHYQFGIFDSMDDLLKSELIKILLYTKFRHYINREKNLGYLIRLQIKSVMDVIFLEFYIETSLELDYVDDCIEEFLILAYDHLEKLSDNEFKFGKKKLKFKYKNLYKFNNLEDKFDKLWQYMNLTNENWNFDLIARRDVCLQTLKKITKQEVINLFEEKLIKNKRKLSARVIGENRRSNENDDANEKNLFNIEKAQLKQKLTNYNVLQQGYLIKDMMKFRQSLKYYPQQINLFL